MWWVKESSDHSRGGFQNRDVGKSNFDADYSPDYGVDYARFSDAPDYAQDAKLASEIKQELVKFFPEVFGSINIRVKNLFVILDGQVPSEEIRQDVKELVHKFPHVREVINQLSIPEQH